MSAVLEVTCGSMSEGYGCMLHLCRDGVSCSSVPQAPTIAAAPAATIERFSCTAATATSPCTTSLTSEANKAASKVSFRVSKRLAD